MELEESIETLLSQSEQVAEENDRLKKVLCSVMQENQELRGRVRRSKNDRMYSFIHDTKDQLREVKQPNQLQSTCDETQFQKDLGEARQRTSSPINFKSFVQNSMAVDGTEFQNCPRGPLPDLKDPERLLGEIIYQLDRRILSHIFQGQRRFYGFNLLNIQDKIIEVSTHPLTGRVDEGYRFYLVQRYKDLMEVLEKLGYKATLHPTLSEFIVNTFGILLKRPDNGSSRVDDYNDPELLRQWITSAAPPQLEKEVQIFLNCLCHMAKKDKKPLILW
ncbi:speriolin-like protein isoform X1 [Takifugu rubripes]|uniref:speriolin-like protein isoform X1 n=1 Tax=Takifugu rubripes TaxID=31033 RepID=UPI0011452EF1|nr:speriolin-like protein isoform X1 [Takifugu rubripes]